MSTQSSRNQEFTSLLFTPRTGRGDFLDLLSCREAAQDEEDPPMMQYAIDAFLTGEQQGLPDYRSPRPNRSPSVHGYGRAKSYAEGATPRSRRSLTPTGSIKDTSMQPPPPSQSLADSLAGDSLRAVSCDGRWLGS